MAYFDLMGLDRITKERVRQMSVEGFDSARDDAYTDDELIDAAIAYLVVAITNPDVHKFAIDAWPWGDESFKPSLDPVRNLEKAGALIAAEIDRRLRVQKGLTGRMQVADDIIQVTDMEERLSGD